MDYLPFEYKYSKRSKDMVAHGTRTLTVHAFIGQQVVQPQPEDIAKFCSKGGYSVEGRFLPITFTQKKNTKGVLSKPHTAVTGEMMAVEFCRLDSLWGESFALERMFSESDEGSLGKDDWTVFAGL